MAGIPLVVSYSYAMLELAQDRTSALFYTPSYYYLVLTVKKLVESNELAVRLSKEFRLKQIFESDELAITLSKTARSIAERSNVASVLGELQINIYKEVIGCE